MKNCPFCDYAGPSPILYEEGGYFIIEPRDPVVEGHVLVIPRRHVEDATVYPGVTGRAMQHAARWARGRGPCNIITSVGRDATQSVFHLHIHVVPRWRDDGLRLPWSPAGVGFSRGR